VASLGMAAMDPLEPHLRTDPLSRGPTQAEP
jgi:hypothetical protein